MRRVISLTLMFLMIVPAAPGAEGIASRIAAMPEGAKIELRLKSKQKMRGTRGPVSASGFTLVDRQTGEHQVAFDDVDSVKQIKSHLTRNILIGVGIGVAAVGITAAILLRCGPLGCGSKL